MSQFFTLLTKTGQGLLANAIAYGEPLTIATMAIGDGGGKLPTPDANVTRLVNEVRRGPINQTAVDDDNPNWTVVEQVLPADVGGWTIREVGLYDTDGNLIAYGNYPETYKPQLSEGSSRTQTIRFVMEVTDTSAVTLKIDPSVVMASRKYVDDSIDKHAKSRNHPDADTKNKGLLRFATLTESKKGEEAKAAQTPAGGMAQLDDHRREKSAHDAGQIALAKALEKFAGAETVQAVLAMLGGAATRGVGRDSGNLMEVGEFGLGSQNPVGEDITSGTLPTGFYSSTAFDNKSFYSAAGVLMHIRRSTGRSFALYGVCNNTEDSRVYVMRENEGGWVQNEVVTTASRGLIASVTTHSVGTVFEFWNGLVIVFGEAASEGRWMSFPLTFSMRPAVVASPNYGNTNDARTGVVFERGVTGFRYQSFYSDGNKSGVGADWIAIGIR